jgi:hypothetical protein
MTRDVIMRLCGVLLFLLATGNVALAQVASDYYNKPSQELFESVSQESTFVHRGGFLPCYKCVRQWAKENRDKYNFLSVACSDSFGIVRVTSSFDCQYLHGGNRPGMLTACNLILTSCSNSLKIGFADLKSRDCGALWRISIEKELVHLISLLPDSVPSPSNPVAAVHIYRGLGYPGIVDSIFDAIRADSIAHADSLFHAHISDSIAALGRIASAVDADSAAGIFAAAHREIDSIGIVVHKDSVEEQNLAAIIFKGQPVLKGKNVTTDAKLDCLVFFLSNKLRTVEQVKAYLVCLEKLCNDQMALYYAARKVVSPEQKYLCVLYYKKLQGDYGKVQAMLYKLENGKREISSPVESERLAPR